MMNGHFLRVTGVDLCQSKKHMAVLLSAENEKITISQHVSTETGQAVLAALNGLPNLTLDAIQTMFNLSCEASVELVGIQITGHGEHIQSILRAEFPEGIVELPLPTEVALPIATSLNLPVFRESVVYKKRNENVPIPSIFKSAFETSKPEDNHDE